MSETPTTDAFEDRVANGSETRAPLVRPLTNQIDYCAAYGEAIEEMGDLERELRAKIAELSAPCSASAALSDSDRRDCRKFADYIEMQLNSKDIAEPYHLLRISRREAEFLRDAVRGYAVSAREPTYEEIHCPRSEGCPDKRGCPSLQFCMNATADRSDAKG